MRRFLARMKFILVPSLEEKIFFEANQALRVAEDWDQFDRLIVEKVSPLMSGFEDCDHDGKKDFSNITLKKTYSREDSVVYTVLGENADRVKETILEITVNIGQDI